MDEIIKCCPFCGSHEVKICGSKRYGCCWVECVNCLVCNKTEEDRNMAIKNWNRRYDDDVSATIVDDEIED